MPYSTVEGASIGSVLASQGRRGSDQGTFPAQGRSDWATCSQPDVGRGVQLELLGDEPAGARRGGPVDAVKAVAGRIVADAGDVGRHVGGAAAHGIAAGHDAHQRRKLGQVKGLGVNDEGRRRRKVQILADVKEAEGVAATEGHGPQAEPAALQAAGLDGPGLQAPRAQGADDTADPVVGQRGVISHLEP